MCYDCGDRVTLRVFATRWLIATNGMLTKPKTMMIMHLQHNMKHIQRLCVSGSWTHEQQSTRFSIGRHLTHTIISLVSVHLGDDSVVEMKGMNVIIVEVLVKNQNKRICIKDDLYKQICSQ